MMKEAFKGISLKRTTVILSLFIAGTILYSCSTTCGVPPKDARGNPTVIQHPNK
jgi:hypothetical protein